MFVHSEVHIYFSWLFSLIFQGERKGKWWYPVEEWKLCWAKVPPRPERIITRIPLEAAQQYLCQWAETLPRPKEALSTTSRKGDNQKNWETMKVGKNCLLDCTFVYYIVFIMCQIWLQVWSPMKSIPFHVQGWGTQRQETDDWPLK